MYKAGGVQGFTGGSYHTCRGWGWDTWKNSYLVLEGRVHWGTSELVIVIIGAFCIISGNVFAHFDTFIIIYSHKTIQN